MSIQDIIEAQTQYLEQRAAETGHQIGLTVLASGCRFRVTNPSTGSFAVSDTVPIADLAQFRKLLDATIGKVS